MGKYLVTLEDTLAVAGALVVPVLVLGAGIWVAGLCESHGVSIAR